jgi:cell shape-determining protein MreD
VGIRAYLKLWEENKVFFYSLIWVICGLFVILSGSITHIISIEWPGIDLIPVFLVYLVARDQGFGAGCLAFIMGMLTDIFAPCQLGLFTFIYSAILLGIDRCRQFFDFNNIKTLVLFVAIFVLAKWALLLIIITFFPLGQFIPSISFVSVSISFLTTCLIAPFFFYLLTIARDKESRNHA